MTNILYQVESEVEGIASEKFNNEIKNYNFIVQAKDKNILTLIPNCKVEKGWYDDLTDENYLKKMYRILYDYLVKQQIIIQEFGFSFFWTGDFTYTLNKNKELFEIDNLKNTLNDTNSDFPNELKCYTINYDKLSNLLKTYNNGITNFVKIIGGKKQKQTKQKQTKTNKNKQNTNKNKTQNTKQTKTKTNKTQTKNKN